MGEIVFTLSIIAFFRVMIKFGFEISAVRTVGRLKSGINEFISTIITIQLLLFFLGVFMLGILACLIEKTPMQWALYTPAYLILLTEIIFVEWFFLGIERMRYFTIRFIIIV